MKIKLPSQGLQQDEAYSFYCIAISWEAAYHEGNENITIWSNID